MHCRVAVRRAVKPLSRSAARKTSEKESEFAQSEASESQVSEEVSSKEKSPSGPNDYSTLEVTTCFVMKGYYNKTKLHFSNPDAAEEMTYTITNTSICHI